MVPMNKYPLNKAVDGFKLGVGINKSIDYFKKFGLTAFFQHAPCFPFAWTRLARLSFHDNR